MWAGLMIINITLSSIVIINFFSHRQDPSSSLCIATYCRLLIILSLMLLPSLMMLCGPLL